MTRPAIVNRPIRQPDQRGTRDALVLMAYAALISAPVLAYVALAAVHQVAAEYRVSKLYATIQELEKRKDRLEVQRETLLGLGQVDRIARERLGMIPEEPAEPNASLPLEAVQPAKAAKATARPANALNPPAPSSHGAAAPISSARRR